MLRTPLANIIGEYPLAASSGVSQQIKMMNKRGALFHWIVFGVLAAIGMFFIYTYGTGIPQELKGPWQLGMINLLYRSDLDLLQLDAQAQGAGWQTIALLAEHGGFAENSPCSQGKGTKTWNDGEQWCLPEIKKNAETIFWQKFGELNKQSFSPLTIDGRRISAEGKTKIKTIKEDVIYFQEYSYPYAFSVDLGYSFDEYNQIFAEARKLVNGCRNQRDLPTCFKKEKNERWFYGYSCLSPQEPPTDTRVWTLCVKSPSDMIIQSVPLVYSFTLDFTPTAPFSVTGINVGYENGNYQITFPFDQNAESYTIYYTDANVLDYRGKVSGILFGTEHNLNHKEINSLLACSNSKEVGKAYHCGDSIVYVLHDDTLVEGQNYYFTVTAMVGKEESEVTEFVVG